MPPDPIETVKQELFEELRRIASRYGGPGEAIEETAISLWKNPEAAGIRATLQSLGVGDRQIESEAFRSPPQTI
jgi:hypothetical protein